MKMLVVLLLVLSLVGSVHAYEKLTPYVSDFAGVLNASERQDLNEYATEIDNKTGVEIAIVTLNSTHGEEPLVYARALGDQNGVGKKGLDNGIVILWVMDVQRGAIATAPGAKALVSDASVQQMGKANRHYFTEGHAYLGFGYMMKAIMDDLQPPQGPPQQPAVSMPLSSQQFANDQQLAVLSNFCYPMMFVAVVVFVLSIFFIPLLSKGSSGSSYSTTCEDTPKEKVKLPKKLPARFVKRYKLVKRNGKYYKKVKKRGTKNVYVYKQCNDNTMIYLWLLYLTFRNNGGYAAQSKDNSGSSGSSGDGGFSSGGYSSSASSSGSFGGGGGFSGGGGGGGGF